MLVIPAVRSRESQYDAVMVALAAAYGVVLATGPGALVIAAGVWWTSNTIAHNFIHRPFFRRRAANRIFALYLSAITGIPQSLWRDRHLAHHACHHHLQSAPRAGSRDVDVATFVVRRRPDDLSLLIDEPASGQLLYFRDGIDDAHRDVGERSFNGGWRFASMRLAVHAINLLNEDGLRRGAAAIGGEDHADPGGINRAHAGPTLDSLSSASRRWTR